MSHDHDLPCVVKRLQPSHYQKIKGTSLQEKARFLRYAFFKELLEEHQADKVALGHNADDQAETLLIWLIRGAGTRGLSGIPAVRENVFIRPLIETERGEIEQFLRQRRIDYVQDSTNYENKYVRNMIRRELIPLLKTKYNPQLVSTLNQTAHILRGEEEYLQEITNRSLKRCLVRKEKGFFIFDVLNLQSLPLAIKLRVLREGIDSLKGNLRQISYKHLLSIVQLLSKTGSSKRLLLPGGIKATKEYNQLVMSRGGKESKTFFYTFFQIPKSIQIKEAEKEMRFTLLKGGKQISFAANQNTVYLDGVKVSFPLIIRNYSSGDWFYPRGMKGRKKVKDFFMDKKIPVSQRKKIPLLLFGDRIAWIGGLRVDQEMAATPQTKDILKVELISKVEGRQI
jgi:tRNA(Ile)-lysidine synthase